MGWGRESGVGGGEDGVAGMEGVGNGVGWGGRGVDLRRWRAGGGEWWLWFVLMERGDCSRRRPRLSSNPPFTTLRRFAARLGNVGTSTSVDD